MLHKSHNVSSKQKPQLYFFFCTQCAEIYLAQSSNNQRNLIKCRGAKSARPPILWKPLKMLRHLVQLLPIGKVIANSADSSSFFPLNNENFAKDADN
jgi:hypothetical protein